MAKSRRKPKSELLRKSRFPVSTRKNNATDSPVYVRWNHMRHRCCVEDDPEYFRYGAKGISVYQEWIEDFFSYERHVMSLNNALKKGYTIDRIKPEGNYEPGNLRWATKTVQSRNCKIGSNNKSGHTGVSWCKQTEKWRAVIAVDYKTINLGRFIELDDAIAARKAGEVKYNFHGEE